MEENTAQKFFYLFGIMLIISIITQAGTPS